jgi:hypothetical protein
LKIDIIKKSKEKRFEIWSNQLKEHLELKYSDKKFSKEEEDRIFYQTNELLLDVSDCFFEY